MKKDRFVKWISLIRGTISNPPAAGPVRRLPPSCAAMGLRATGVPRLGHPPNEDLNRSLNRGGSCPSASPTVLGLSPPRRGGPPPRPPAAKLLTWIVLIPLLTLSSARAIAQEPMESMPGHDMGGLSGGTRESKPMNVMEGRMIYTMVCVQCHGSRGKGDGPASIFIGPYSHPRPNDFTQGAFKFRSTESGELPLLEDLMRTIREGIPGYMPSFRNLGEGKIRNVALFIRSEFIKEDLPTESTIRYVEHAGPYVYSIESVRRGEKLYNEMKCFECHGSDGRGADGALKDQRGLSIHPVDLTRPETFGNGTSHQDIYRTIMTGLDGTPMPGYSNSFTGKEDSAWDLVHYILFLQEK